MTNHKVVIESPTGHWEFEARDQWEADYIATRARAGEYVADPDTVETYYNCWFHGWTPIRWGVCTECYRLTIGMAPTVYAPNIPPS